MPAVPGLPPSVRFHVERVNAESVGDDHLKRLHAPTTACPLCELAGEFANAKTKIAQSWALMVHCCTRLVWAVPEAQSNRGVRGTTRGCLPATPRVRSSRQRAEVRGARPTAVAIAAVNRGGFEKRLRTMTKQKNRNDKFGCSSLSATGRR